MLKLKKHWKLLVFYQNDKKKNKTFVSFENKWTMTRQNVSSGVSDQARRKPACAATEAS